MQSIIRKETASNYDNVIATSNWVGEEDEPPAEQVGCCDVSKELDQLTCQFMGNLNILNRW